MFPHVAPVYHILKPSSLAPLKGLLRPVPKDLRSPTQEPPLLCLLLSREQKILGFIPRNFESSVDNCCR
jgi:hypothetical protein